MSFAITTIYASLCGLLIVAQGLNVSRLRRAHLVSLGDGENRALRKAIRVHGNTTENVPIAMLLLLLLEAGGGPVWALHTFGAFFVFARLCHHWGIVVGRGGSPTRVIGTAGSWLVIAVLSVVNLVRVLG